MKDFKIEHDKRRNWYFYTCQRCGEAPHGFFRKADGERWSERHLQEKHGG